MSRRGPVKSTTHNKFHDPGHRLELPKGHSITAKTLLAHWPDYQNINRGTTIKKTPLQDYYKVDAITDHPTGGTLAEDRLNTQHSAETEDIDEHLSEQVELQIGIAQESNSDSESSDGYMSSLEEPPQKDQTRRMSQSRTRSRFDTGKKMHYTWPEKPRFYEHSVMTATEPEQT